MITGETEDIKAYSEALPKLVGIGLQVPVDWAQNKLGIPMPEAGQAVLGAAPLTRPDPNGPIDPADPKARALPAALTARLPGQSGAQQARQAQLAQLAAPAIDAWYAQIRQLVMESDSMEQIRDGLDKLLPSMDTTAYADAMGLALTVARLAGRWDVLQEAGGT